jgi:peptidoglycan/xylan/chitin deacetylase (PgdA/CDA1 family)
MKARLRKSARRIAPLAFRAAARLSPATSIKPIRPTVLLYHDVPRERSGRIDSQSFEAHVRLLRERFDIVPHTEAFTERPGRRRVILTFDDGFKNNANVAVPILRKYQVPALFFVSTRHLEPGKYLWFLQLQATEAFVGEVTLSFHGQEWDLTRPHRAATIRRLRKHLVGLKPHPSAMYDAIEEHLPPLESFISPEVIADRYAGLSREELHEIASDPLFEIGNHTHDHPYLTRCSLEEAKRQIALNTSILEEVTGKPCRTMAYPIGDYNGEVLRAVEESGFDSAFAVSVNVGRKAAFEIPRFGLYTASSDVLAFKVIHGMTCRRLGVNF